MHLIDFHAQQKVVNQATITSGVYGINRVLATGVYFTFPSWNQYCLAMDLNTGLVSLSVNGNLTANSVLINGLSKSTSIILNSKIFVTNEMFGWVNIYSQALAQVDPSSAGTAVAWLVSDWKYTASVGNGTIKPVASLPKWVVLAGKDLQMVTVLAPQNFDTAVTTCNNLGSGGLLPDPANIQAWTALLNSTAVLLGPSWTGWLDLWLPYTSTKVNSNSSDYFSVYAPGKRMDSSLWGAGQPSPGKACVHCSYSGCFDDNCAMNLGTTLCQFPGSKPVLQLRGLCMKSRLGNQCEQNSHNFFYLSLAISSYKTRRL